MARQPRFDFAGAWHHVMHRGARRAPIFLRDAHCTLFLDAVRDMVERFEIEVHAYALMPNHYHLLLRSRHGNLSRAMRLLNAEYTQRVNRLHRWDGPLFRGRFRSQLVSDDAALPVLLAYIHLNPLRANLVTRLEQESWTSHRAYLELDAAPSWLTRERFLAFFGDALCLHEYVLGLHQGAIEWPGSLALDTGWLAAQPAHRQATRKKVVDGTRFLSPDQVLDRVCAITGRTRRALRQTTRGPGANPARRFAVWALDRFTPCTQRELGEILRMPVGQVAKVIARQDLSIEPLKSWKDQWS